MDELLRPQKGRVAALKPTEYPTDEVDYLARGTGEMAGAKHAMAAPQGHVRRSQACALAALTLMLATLVALEVRLQRAPRGSETASALAVSLPNVPPISTMQTRSELPNLFQCEKLKTGIEVGVFQGGWSAYVLSRWPACERYVMIDPWLHQSNYADGANLPQEQQEGNLARAIKNTAPYRAKAQILRMPSPEAAVNFSSGSIDVIYIDGRHDFTSVRLDLAAWWRVLRPGGLLAGHDYVDADEERDFRRCTGLFASHPLFAPSCKSCGSGSACPADWGLQPDGSIEPRRRAVKSAVDEFAAAQHVQVQVTYKDETSSFFWESWVLRKPPLAISPKLAAALGGSRARELALRARLAVRPIPTFRTRVELLDIAAAERLTVAVEVGQPFLDELRLPPPWRGCTAYTQLLQRPAGGALPAASPAEQAASGGAAVSREYVDELRLAAARVPDGSVDFVWLSLTVGFSHTSLLEAMDRWWPKLRTGGLLAGPAYIEVPEMRDRAGCTGLVRIVDRWRALCRPVCTVAIRSAADALVAAGNASDDGQRCWPDLVTQPDGRLMPHGLRSAVDSFAANVSRQVQVSYRETTLPSTLPLFFTSWAIRS